jgi:hypothetical protein
MFFQRGRIAMDRTEANSLAGSCITSALLDILLSKGVLTLEETRAMLMKAHGPELFPVAARPALSASSFVPGFPPMVIHSQEGRQTNTEQVVASDALRLGVQAGFRATRSFHQAEGRHQ